MSGVRPMKRAVAYATILAALLALPAVGQDTTANEQPPASAETTLPHPGGLWPMPEVNGWDDLLLAIELLSTAEQHQGDKDSSIMSEGPASFEESELFEFLFAYQPALDRLREALGKRFVVPYQWMLSDQIWEHHYQELTQVKRFAQILAAKALISQHYGEHYQALDDFRQSLNLSQRLSQGGMLIHRLVGMAIKAIALHHMQEWIGSRPPVEVLREAVRFFREFEQQQVPVWKIMTMEAWYSRQTMIGLDVADLPAEELAAWEHEMESYYAQLVEIVKLPLWEVLEQPMPEPHPGQFAGICSPVHLRAFQKEALIATQLGGTRIMAALELYRYNQPHQGRYPPTLQDLVPEYLPEVPKDPFTGEDFLYVRPDNLKYTL